MSLVAIRGSVINSSRGSVRPFTRLHVHPGIINTAHRCHFTAGTVTARPSHRLVDRAVCVCERERERERERETERERECVCECVVCVCVSVLCVCVCVCSSSSSSSSSGGGGSGVVVVVVGSVCLFVCLSVGRAAYMCMCVSE